jgi:hypothetical protein
LGLEILEARAVPTVTAVSQSFSTIPNTPTPLNVLGPDAVASGEPVSLLSVGAISPGGPTLTRNADGSLTFTSASMGTFTFDHTITGTQQEVVANNGGTGAEFGQSVAISGDTVGVGASRQGVGSHSFQGAAYVFTLSGSTWSLQQELTASNGAAFDQFGYSVAISGDTIVVGAIQFVVGTSGPGAAWVFTRSGTTWSQQQELTASDGAASDFFGGTVSISGDTVVVGAARHKVGANTSQGAAYVFTRSGTTWSQQQELTADDGGQGDNFGVGVAVDGDTVAVGANIHPVVSSAGPGAAYVFTRSGTTWSLQQELSASDGASGDSFGESVAISGSTLVVGAFNHTVGTTSRQGAAYVFTLSDGAWSQQQELTSSDGGATDNFGVSVAISGGTIAVGAPGHQVGGHAAQGAAYVFTFDGTTWNQQQELTAPDGVANAFLGIGLALDGDTAVAGAYAQQVGSTAQQGAAYIQDVSTSTATVTVNVGSTIVVTTTADSGPGSLRQAILDVNASSGGDKIAFHIGSGGVQTIKPTSPLPTITQSVTIDGTTQPGFTGSPLIVLDGSNISGNGLVISAGTSTVLDLVVDNFKTGYGIALTINGGNVLAGNYVGTDVTGAAAAHDQGGVLLLDSSNNTIGGAAAGAGNVVSGNSSYGLYLQGNSNYNVVEGNYFGTDATGATALGNSYDIRIDTSGNTIGGAAAGAGNVISGSFAGIYVSSGTGNQIQGNYIGTDATGTKALANSFGVTLWSSSSGTMVGGTASGAGNLISGNSSDGLQIFANNNVVQGNTVGTDVTGATALANGGDGVIVTNGSNNTIGGTSAGAGNLLSGNNGDGIGLAASSGNGTGNVIQGNLIGADITGAKALGNARGIYLNNMTGTLIGGTAAGAGNVISGNTGDGIFFFAGSMNQVQGNFIGTDWTGTQALGNGQDGVAISLAQDNTIGGTASGAGNVISANGGSGVSISGASAQANVIQGNFIGTDQSATINLGNAVNGVTVAGGSNNTIGGTAPGAGNSIAFNGNDGVLVDTGAGNTILSDLIFSSGNLGIELTNNGNANQAAPQLASAGEDGSTTVVQGTISGPANTTFSIQFYSDPAADPTGHAEGQTLLGILTVTTDGSGTASFSFTASQAVAAGQVVTATATNTSTNNTSAFADPIAVTGP